MPVFVKVLKLFSFNSASIVEQNDFSFIMRKQLLLLLPKGFDRQMQKKNKVWPDKGCVTGRWGSPTPAAKRCGKGGLNLEL